MPGVHEATAQACYYFNLKWHALSMRLNNSALPFFHRFEHLIAVGEDRGPEGRDNKHFIPYGDHWHRRLAPRMVRILRQHHVQHRAPSNNLGIRLCPQFVEGRRRPRMRTVPSCRPRHSKIPADSLDRTTLSEMGMQNFAASPVHNIPRIALPSQ